MPSLDRNTGGIVTDFDEVMQSLSVILTTRKRTRVMRRDVGSQIPSLVDRPLSPLTLIDFYAAIADAVRQEPRFRLSRVSLAEDSTIDEGKPVFDILGLWYPRGHLGDFSEVRDARGSIIVA